MGQRTAAGFLGEMMYGRVYQEWVDREAVAEEMATVHRGFCEWLSAAARSAGYNLVWDEK